MRSPPPSPRSPDLISRLRGDEPPECFASPECWAPRRIRSRHSGSGKHSGGHDEPDGLIVRHTLGEVVFAEGSDAEALRAIAAGDRRAFEAFYARHRQPLWSFIRQFAADATSATWAT